MPVPLSSNLPDPRQLIPTITLGICFLGHPAPLGLRMVSCSSYLESVRGVPPFRVFIFRDRRSVLYAGFVLSGYCVRFDHTASNLVLLNPALFLRTSQRWQVVLHDASSIPSLIVDPSHLLDEVTVFGSRLIAFLPRF